MFKYKETSHLPKSEQTLLLEKARYAAFTELKLGPRAVLHFALILIFGTVAMFMSSQILNSYLSSGLVGLAMVLAYQISNSSIIAKGLKHVLKN